MLAACSTAPVSQNREREHDRGLASWYGNAFRGRRTANGERFNPKDLTAAHRSLPFGTLVEVRDLHSGKSVVVRVNDRGPFDKGRIIDLSYAAARKLGILTIGATPVELRIVGRVHAPAAR